PARPIVLDAEGTNLFGAFNVKTGHVLPWVTPDRSIPVSFLGSALKELADQPAPVSLDTFQRSLDPRWIDEATPGHRHGDAAGSAGCQQSKSSARTRHGNRYVTGRSPRSYHTSIWHCRDRVAPQWLHRFR